jgi:hypothetical protein
VNSRRAPDLPSQRNATRSARGPFRVSVHRFMGNVQPAAAKQTIQ